jgi:Ni,Fe-hydrogenase maturation factor
MCIQKETKKEIKSKKIYVLGNVLLKEDSLPIKLIPRLEKRFPEIKFVEFDPLEEIDDKEINILDTVIGIKDVELITEIEKIENRKIYSAHDLDLGFFIKLWKRLGIIKNFRIIGIPTKMNEEEALKQIEKIIEKKILNS